METAKHCRICIVVDAVDEAGREKLPDAPVGRPQPAPDVCSLSSAKEGEKGEDGEVQVVTRVTAARVEADLTARGFHCVCRILPAWLARLGGETTAANEKAETLRAADCVVLLCSAAAVATLAPCLAAIAARDIPIITVRQECQVDASTGVHRWPL